METYTLVFDRLLMVGLVCCCAIASMLLLL
jgi:hypothetical protein